MTFLSDIRREPRRTSRAGAKLLVLALLPMTMAGCKHLDQGPQVAGWALVDPVQRHPIIVSQQPAHLHLNVPPGSQGMSPGQRAELLNFAGRFRASDSGASRIVIAAPSGSSNEVAAIDVVEEARNLLLDVGFNEAAIAVEAYHDGRAAPPVRISYMTYVAEGPVCGRDWSENLAVSKKNIAHPNFGCTSQQNLAAMIANPADLLGPRSETPRDGTRRDVVHGKWAKGEVTAAEKTEDERVRVRGAD